jgi:hypothetical protein
VIARSLAVSKPNKSKAAKQKTGRPSDYTDDKADKICAAVASGSNLNLLCRQYGMPDRVTVYRWLGAQETFRNNYARAREDRADFRADRIDDYVTKLLAGEIDANQARVAIDAEKWQAGKEKPKRYGDKLELSGDPENPLSLMVGVEKSLDGKLDRLIGRRTDGDKD